jgi:hypothetical protein
MRSIRMIIVVSVTLALTTLSCNKNDQSDVSLKQAVDNSTTLLNNAMNDITASKAYGLLTLSDGGQKSAETADPVYKTYITLDKIKGVYNYTPVSTTDKWGIPLIRYFSKTADDNMMIVNMPLKKVERPWSLRQILSSDSELTNNFSISVSDYHNNYNSYHDFDYLLASEISIDGSPAGKLNIKSIVSPDLGKDYASQYVFTDGYTAEYKYLSGDPSVYTFAINDNDKVLYEEKRETTENTGSAFKREQTYTLTIGDFKIVRKSGIKEPSIYVNDVLQTEAVVEIIDREEDQEASVCRKRDIQITFDDGTTTTLSALIGESVEDIKTLFESLHDVYFAAYIVDWIAYDIYYQRN